MENANLAQLNHEYSIHLADVCLPDYFQGCGLDNCEVLSISVRSDTKRAQIIESLVSEFHSSSTDEIPEEFNTHQFRQLLEKDITAKDEDFAKAFQYIGVSEEDEYDGYEVYAYFILSWSEKEEAEEEEDN